MKSPHHVNPLEMVEAAVGVVDMAWTAIEKRREHAHHDAVAATWEDCVKLEGELIQERSENHRLKAALEDLRRALNEVKSRDCNYRRNGVPDYNAIDKDDCPSNLYEQLQERVDSPIFRDRLKNMQGIELQEQSLVASEGMDLNNEDYASWEVVSKDVLNKSDREQFDGADDDDFILVSQDDIIESLAAFVARLVVSNPRAQAMTPKQLQEVISVSFAKLEQKGKLKKLWTTVKLLYSGVTWTATVATTAVGLYKNPFIVRTLFKAVTMSSRLMIKALTC
ncbi:hypothetical protein KP509_25G064600 [Ceratopteris richardii]|uniref:Uncharacterized protein n=1 Tax=Ceratopteris richardii TaxID=49495 RepID=A0A8T2RR43_CERRI|nr:hypothetical protein KP509_25G064600 [Ceratopteris richardii]